MVVIQRSHDMRCNVQHVSSLGVRPSVAGACPALVVMDIAWTLTCTCNLHAGLHSSRHAEGACAQDQVCVVSVYCMSAVSLLGDTFYCVMCLLVVLLGVLAATTGSWLWPIMLAIGGPPWQYRLLAQPGAAYWGFLHSHPCCARRPCKHEPKFVCVCCTFEPGCCAESGNRPRACCWTTQQAALSRFRQCRMWCTFSMITANYSNPPLHVMPVVTMCGGLKCLSAAGLVSICKMQLRNASYTPCILGLWLSASQFQRCQSCPCLRQCLLVPSL